MAKKFTRSFGLSHVDQLTEIDRALQERGEDGILPHLQELISRLTSGGVAGKSGDPRVIQAKRLFDRGWGRELELTKFEEYLATIPEIPESLIADDTDFPLIGLDDPRVDLAKSCRMAGVQFGYSNEYAVPCDERHSDLTEPYWFRAHDGRKNSNRKPSDCRKEATHPILAMTARVGVMTFVHHQNVISEGEHVLDLPGTLHRGWPGHCAYLKVWSGQPLLDLSRGDVADPHCGSGLFRRG